MRESDTNSDLRSKNVETGTRSVDHGIIKISFLRSPTRIEIYNIYIVCSRSLRRVCFCDTHILVKIRISIEGNKVQRGPRAERKFSPSCQVFLTRATAKRNKRQSENSFSCTNLWRFPSFPRVKRRATDRPILSLKRDLLPLFFSPPLFFHREIPGEKHVHKIYI